MAALFNLLKALVAGTAAGAVATFASFTLLHQPAGAKRSADPQSNLPLTAVGAAIGGLAGLGVAATGRRQRGRIPAEPASGTWQGWREVVVSRKRQESAEIMSFELSPVDDAPLARYLPGQFLTLELLIPGQAKPTIRTYSLSDYPSNAAAPDHYRCSVKREPAPAALGDQVPPGLASNFLHDSVQEGARIRILAPAGQFVLDEGAKSTIVLISNGVGITPMLAMLKASASLPLNRDIWFIHGCRNSRSHAFRDEVTCLAAPRANVHVHVAYSRPLPEDAGLYDSEGYVDAALVQSLIQEPAQYYLCGSPAFMQAMLDDLRRAGVEEQAIRFESFSKAEHAPDRADSLTAAVTPVPSCAVHFQRSKCTATWTARDPEQSLLELAEAEGLSPAFACRAGVCGTCSTRVLEGVVSNITAPSARVEPGAALICIGKPGSSRLSLDQ